MNFTTDPSEGFWSTSITIQVRLWTITIIDSHCPHIKLFLETLFVFLPLCKSTKQLNSLILHVTMFADEPQDINFPCSVSALATRR